MINDKHQTGGDGSTNIQGNTINIITNTNNFYTNDPEEQEKPSKEAVSRPPDNTLLEEPESHAKELFIGIILCLLIFSGVVLINGADYTPSGVSPAPENRITSNGDDTTSQVNTTVSDQPLPVADFSADITLGNAPLTVRFTDMSKNANEWNWNLGDKFITKDQSPEHTYTKAGIYTVEETVSNAKGNSKMNKLNYITVAPPLPPLVANFSADKTAGNAPLTVRFTDKSAGSPTRWKWSFGDGNTSTECNPKYTYSTAGTYTVKETVFRETISNQTESKNERKINYITVWR